MEDQKVSDASNIRKDKNRKRPKPKLSSLVAQHASHFNMTTSGACANVEKEQSDSCPSLREQSFKQNNLSRINSLSSVHRQTLKRRPFVAVKSTIPKSSEIYSHSSKLASRSLLHPSTLLQPHLSQQQPFSFSTHLSKRFFPQSSSSSSNSLQKKFPLSQPQSQKRQRLEQKPQQEQERPQPPPSKLKPIGAKFFESTPPSFLSSIRLLFSSPRKKNLPQYIQPFVPPHHLTVAPESPANNVKDVADAKFSVNTFLSLKQLQSRTDSKSIYIPQDSSFVHHSCTISPTYSYSQDHPLSPQQLVHSPSQPTVSFHLFQSKIQDKMHLSRLFRSFSFQNFDQSLTCLYSFFYKVILNPAFLTNQNISQTEEPVLIQQSAGLHRDLHLVDLTLSYEIHKIGVLYVKEGQTREDQFLSNQFGSPSYFRFLKGLGSFIQLNGCPEDIYTGGLDKNEGSDGDCFLMWRDSFTQVLFHVATMMPLYDNHCQNKKRHIGNNYITIVFCDNSRGFSISSLSGQYHFIVIVIFPYNDNFFGIYIHRKNNNIPAISSEISYVDASHLSLRVRELAIVADLAARSTIGDLQAENWIQRLAKIRRMVQRYSRKPKVAGVNKER